MQMGGSSLFESEAHLTDHIHFLLPTWLAPFSMMTVKREVGVGRSLADIVVLSHKRCQQRIALPALSVLESFVLSVLRRHGTSRIDSLERHCGLTRGGLRNGELSRIHQAGLITLRPGGYVRVRQGKKPRGKIIAFEAKISRWKMALEQAIRYLRYADASFVALPDDRAEPALRARDAFEKAGVGLIVVGGNSLTQIVGATPSNTHDWQREFVYSRLARVD